MNKQLVVLAVVIRVFPEEHGEDRVFAENISVVECVATYSHGWSSCSLFDGFVITVISRCRKDHPSRSLAVARKPRLYLHLSVSSVLVVTGSRFLGPSLGIVFVFQPMDKSFKLAQSSIISHPVCFVRNHIHISFDISEFRNSTVEGRREVVEFTFSDFQRKAEDGAKLGYFKIIYGESIWQARNFYSASRPIEKSLFGVGKFASVLGRATTFLTSRLAWFAITTV